MTPDRIKLFLRCFYECYVVDCYEGYDIESDPEQGLSEKMNNYNVQGYFIENLDIYVSHCDFMKEYSILYNPALFTILKKENPEPFNELQIFLIENIQLFFHTILEAAINSYVLKTSKIKGLKLYMKPIDNTTIRLLDLIDTTENNMKKLNVLPPAMG
jgi:hypothetical protein